MGPLRQGPTVYVRAVQDNYPDQMGYSQNQRHVLNWTYLLDSRLHINTLKLVAFKGLF